MWMHRFRLRGDQLMSAPRNPDRDLRLERLGDRDGLRPAPLGEAAHVGAPLGHSGGRREFSAAYQALIDAVFTAPGASEWLFGLRLAVATMVAPRGETPRNPVAPGAIRAADPGAGRA
jgi:hypothetical protein